MNEIKIALKKDSCPQQLASLIYSFFQDSQKNWEQHQWVSDWLNTMYEFGESNFHHLNGFPKVLENIENFHGKVWQYSTFSQFLPQPRLLMYISHIKFTCLTNLILNQLNLVNIEPIQWIQAPLLEQINLFQNKIISFKPLHKLNLPNFYNIYFSDNLYNSTSLEILSRTKLQVNHPENRSYHFRHNGFNGIQGIDDSDEQNFNNDNCGKIYDFGIMVKLERKRLGYNVGFCGFQTYGSKLPADNMFRVYTESLRQPQLLNE